MSNVKETLRKKILCNGEEMEVIYKKLQPRPAPGKAAAKALADGHFPAYMQDGFGDYPPLNPRTYEVSPGIICEQDVLVTLRDGCKTYCDIFRPAGEKKVPVIISCSFYGKRPCADNPDLTETPDLAFDTIGVPHATCSPNCKFEGPDPEYWCHRGYAIANYDQRGTNNSEGDITMAASGDGEDCYDLIEFLAAQPWCTGKVAMAGNSGLAACQWKAAALRPPHLTCIAPWEGTTDTYRYLSNAGGIAECGFNPFLTSLLFGEGYMEDHYLMSKEHPLYDNYWKDKVADLENIEVPIYITGGWNHFHLYGAIDGWNQVSSREKWLRIHREFEWPDQYERENIDDLTRFFDRYLRGVRNGWESTPRVRIDVMDAYGRDHAVRAPVADFPLPGTRYEKLWLDAANGSLRERLPKTKASCAYHATSGRATFDYRVEKETLLIGHMKLRLWVEARGHDEMDLFIAVKKLDADGSWVPVYVLDKPHPGAPGKLRVSLRELDEEKTTDYRPWQTLDNPQKLSPGEVVPVDIDIWPSSRIWHKGEQIRVEVMGRYERFDWFEPFDFDTDNRGEHVIHTGGEYDSYLQIPVIDAYNL